MDGWKMSFLLGFPIFRGYVGIVPWFVWGSCSKISSREEDGRPCQWKTLSIQVHTGCWVQLVGSRHGGAKLWLGLLGVGVKGGFCPAKRAACFSSSCWTGGTFTLSGQCWKLTFLWTTYIELETPSSKQSARFTQEVHRLITFWHMIFLPPNFLSIWRISISAVFSHGNRQAQLPG